MKKYIFIDHYIKISHSLFFLNNIKLPLNKYILKNILPGCLNNVYKFSDELLYML